MGYQEVAITKKMKKLKKGYDTWNGSVNLSGIEIVERITSKEEEKCKIADIFKM